MSNDSRVLQALADARAMTEPCSFHESSLAAERLALSPADPPSETQARPLAIAFGPQRRRLFGMHHAPVPSQARGAGVVLCNPLGYESMSVHRTYRHLATSLALAGFDVLRFDYHGTGDAPGSSQDTEHMNGWLEDIGAAAAELRSLGARSLCLAGIRLGATLALLAAPEIEDLDALVLWAPVTSGRAYLRELRAWSLLRRAPGESGVQLLHPVIASELRAVDLTTVTSPLGARALIVPRDDLAAGEGAVAKALTARGAVVTTLPVTGFAELMREPEEAVVPERALTGIASWLSSSAPRPGRAAAAPPARSSVLFAKTPAGLVREESVRFGPDDRLFGILSEPGHAPPKPRDTAVLLLSCGANHRVGPGRLYVRMARFLAARGYPVLRIDFGGLGDSPPAPGARENELYSKKSQADVQAAMTFLAKSKGFSKFVLAGVCSGAYAAFHTAVADERVAGQIGMNPQTFDWHEGDSLTLTPGKGGHKSMRYYLRALRDKHVWAQAFRGELDIRCVARAMGDRLITQLVSAAHSGVAWALRLPEPRTSVERALAKLSERGTKSLLVFSESDGGLDMIEQHLGAGASRAEKYAGLSVTVIEGADHTFTAKGPREKLFELLMGFLERQFA